MRKKTQNKNKQKRLKTMVEKRDVEDEQRRCCSFWSFSLPLVFPYQVKKLIGLPINFVAWDPAKQSFFPPAPNAS
jgi:hypothetical protein